MKKVSNMFILGLIIGGCIGVIFMDRKQKDKTLMVFTGKDASKMANIAMCEIYGKITKGDNIYLDDIKKNLAKKY